MKIGSKKKQQEISSVVQGLVKKKKVEETVGRRDIYKGCVQGPHVFVNSAGSRKITFNFEKALTEKVLITVYIVPPKKKKKACNIDSRPNPVHIKL